MSYKNTCILLLGFCIVILNCIESLKTTYQYFELQESTHLASDYITVESPSNIDCGFYCSQYLCKAASFDKLKRECKIYLNNSREMETVYAEHAVLIETKERWHLFNDSYYYIGLTPMSWTDAQAVCRNKKSNLVKIDDNTEQQWIISLMNRYRDNNYDVPVGCWIGGNDLEYEGSWVWVSDNTPFTFDAWSPDLEQPNNWQSVQHCACMWWNFELLWNDENCDVPIPYICEK